MSVTHDKRPFLRAAEHSSGSLSGLERTIPPARSTSALSMYSDLNNKPLPPRPYEFDDEASSIYSMDMCDLIDLYLTDQSLSYNILPEAARSQQSLAYEYAASGTSIAHGNGKLASESVLRNIHPVDTSNKECNKRTELGATKYRHSSPSPHSPRAPTLTITSPTRQRDTWMNDAARSYRETLLPDPFTPISTKAPGLFTESLPLRGPRSTQPPAVPEVSQLLPRAVAPALSGTTFFMDEVSRPSTASSQNSATRSKHIANLRSHLIEYSWEYEPKKPPSETSSLHAPFSYTNSPASSTSEVQDPIRARPPPAPYRKSRQTSFHVDVPSQSGSISSISGTTSHFELSGTPSPLHWSPILKSSNPNVVHIPKEERSPAVPLSPYQLHGPKAWEEEDRRKSGNDHRERKGFFGRHRNGKSFEKQREVIQDGPLQAPKRPPRPLDFSDGHSFPDVQSPMALGSPRVTFATEQTNSTSRNSRIRTYSSSFTSPISETFRSSRRRISLKNETNSPWSSSKKKKARTEAWREDIKKRITIVSSRDSTGVPELSPTRPGSQGLPFERLSFTQSSPQAVELAASFSPNKASPERIESPGGWI